MSNLLFSLNSVLPLFGVMAVGYFLRQKNFFDKSFLSTINKFCFKVTLPCLLFKSTYGANVADIFNGKLMAVTIVGILLVTALLCLIVPRFIPNKQKASAVIQGAFRSNAALFGLPLAMNMFGEAGIGPATILLTVVIPIYNILAVVVLQYFAPNGAGKVTFKTVWHEVSRNYLIIGALLGIAFSMLNFTLPQALERTVFDIASVATPLAMLSLGAQFDLSGAISNITYNLITCALRLVIIPAGMIWLSVWLGFRGPELGALFVVFASPTASSSFIMAHNMGSDGDLAGQIVVSTTFFSVLTVFAGVFLLRSLGLI